MTALLPEDELPSPELAPRRLLDGGAGEHARNLVASARLDRVPGGAKARAAAALSGVLELHAEPGPVPNGELARAAEEDGPAHTSCDDAKAGGDTLPRFGARSTLAVVSAGIVGAVALSHWVLAPRESASATTHAAPAASATIADPDANHRAQASRSEFVQPPAFNQEPALNQRPVLDHQSAVTRRPALTAQPERSPLDAPPRHGHSEPQRPKNQADTARAAAVDTGLLAEVRALEAVSAALSAHDADRAERELAAYRRRFARGELAIEADVLAIEIDASRGDLDTAKASAERLLARPGAEHYRARVRSLLERSAPPMGSATPENAPPRRSNDATSHMRARR